MKQKHQFPQAPSAADPSPPTGNEAPKVIRDGFTMPVCDYSLIAEIRTAMLNSSVVATKSGILRAALHALSAMSLEEQIDLINSLEAMKTGRPAKDTALSDADAGRD
jgi:hypothetical protein